MKTKYWLFATATLTMMACSQNDEVTEQPPVVTDSDFEAPDGRVVIQLGSGGYQADAEVSPASLTRTSYESINDITNKDGLFGVFAIHGAPEGWTQAENRLLNNIKATLSADDTSTDKDGSEKSGLNKMHLYESATGSTQNYVHYYPVESSHNYTFYAYAPFDKDRSGVGGTYNPYVFFHGFKGNEDIIWSKAEAPTIEANSIHIPGTETLYDQPLNGYNSRYLRYLKAHWEKNQNTEDAKYYPWIPNFNFTHRMVRLKFSVVPASAQSEADKESAKKLNVNSIQITDHPSSLKMNMETGAMEAFNATTKSINIYKLNNKTAYTDEVLGEVQVADDNLVGYVMVIPGQKSYNISLKIGSSDVAQKITLNHPENGTFEAGQSYHIKLGIYALQQVEVTASLTAWGEDTDIDLPVDPTN